MSVLQYFGLDVRTACNTAYSTHQRQLLYFTTLAMNFVVLINITLLLSSSVVHAHHLTTTIFHINISSWLPSIQTYGHSLSATDRRIKSRKTRYAVTASEARRLGRPSPGRKLSLCFPTFVICTSKHLSPRIRVNSLVVLFIPTINYERPTVTAAFYAFLSCDKNALYIASYTHTYLLTMINTDNE